MKFKKYIPFLLIALASSCSINNNLSNTNQESNLIADIQISSMPAKKEYVIGETFTKEGLEVKAYYNDGTIEDITDKITLSNPDLSTIGTKIVDITFNGLKKSFTIVVNNVKTKSISVKSLPSSTDVLRNGSINLDGLLIEAEYVDGTKKEITDYTIAAVDLTTIGSKVVTVYYGDQLATFDINVINNQNEPQILFAPFSEEESKYMFEDFGSNKGETDDHLSYYRFADGFNDKPGADIRGNYWVYCLNLGSKIDSAELIVTLGGNYRVGVSFDEENWEEIDRWEGTDDYNRSPVTYDYDISDLKAFEDNKGLVFIRFYSAEEKGFGCFMRDFRFDYSYENKSSYIDPTGSPYLKKVSFAANGIEDEPYITIDNGKVEKFEDVNGWLFNLSLGTEYRTTSSDLESYMVYHLDAGAKIDSARLSYTIAGGHKVSLSTDNIHWTVVNENMWTQKTEALACVQTISNTLQKDWADFASNNGDIYVKIQTNHDGSGWSGTKLVNMQLEYSLENMPLSEYPELQGATEYEKNNRPDVPIIQEDGVIKFNANGTDDASYLTSDGSSLIEVKNGGWSLNIEDGQSYRTTGNSAGSYFVYLLDAKEKMTSATLSMLIASNYVVSVSFDGTNYIEIAREDKNVEADACKKIITSDLSILEGFDSNSGKIYVKFESTGTFWAGVRVMNVNLKYDA